MVVKGNGQGRCGGGRGHTGGQGILGDERRGTSRGDEQQLGTSSCSTERGTLSGSQTGI